MTVYIVEIGTKFEGGSAIAAFTTRAAAEKHCRERAEERAAPVIEQCLKDGQRQEADGWRVKERPIESYEAVTLSLEWGCYYACVSPMEVRE